MIEVLPTVELIWADASGSTASTTLSIPIGTTVAAADAALDELASVVAPLTGATLIKKRLTYRKVEKTPAAAAIGSSIKRAGVFILNTVEDTQLCLVSIPSIGDTYLVTSGFTAGIDIDLSNDDVTAFVDALTSNGIVNPLDFIVTTVAAAYRQSRT